MGSLKLEFYQCTRTWWFVSEMTQFVPMPSGHPSCSLVLSELDMRHHALRQDLATMIRTGAVADVLTQRWQEYDAAVAEIGAVYTTMDAIQESSVAALATIQTQISEYTNRALGESDHALSIAVSKVAQLEGLMPRVHTLATMGPDDVMRTITMIATPLAELATAMLQCGRELSGAVANADHAISEAWRMHAFPTSQKLAAHARFAVPSTMRTRLQLLADPHTAVPAGSSYAESAWAQLSGMPLGIRLGSLARYGNPDHVGNRLLLEQLMLSAPNSLLNAAVHARLRSSLVAQPNASMPPDGQVPLLGIMYAVWFSNERVCPDLSDAISEYSSERLVSAIRTRVDQFDSEGLLTRDERANPTLPYIGAFFEMAELFVLMGKRLDVESLPSFDASRSLNASQRQFCAIMRCLTSLRARDSVLFVAARLFFWVRYSERVDANSAQFWRYRIRRKRLMCDVSAFIGTRSMWGSSCWTVSVPMVGK